MNNPFDPEEKLIGAAFKLTQKGPWEDVDGNCATCGANPYQPGGTGEILDHGSHTYGCEWVELDRVLRRLEPALYEKAEADDG